MNVSREIRMWIAAAIVALCPVSIVASMWLLLTYYSSGPREPHPEQGLLYALNNHGVPYVYVSASESTGLGLLMIAPFVSFFAAFAIVPKEAIIAPPGTLPWITRIGS